MGLSSLVWCMLTLLGHRMMTFFMLLDHKVEINSESGVESKSCLDISLQSFSKNMLIL